MEKQFYVLIKESESTGYIILQEMFPEDRIKKQYECYVEMIKELSSKYESFDGYALRYLITNVKYDGRKGVQEADVIKTLEDSELITEVSEGGIFGAYYAATDKLKDIMRANFSKRKQLAGLN
ncbi:hypothetical protein U8V72_17485 [Priestia filamentosa]|uniref:hypothetical protein n=1 Tax=Priestia filamentosa TaxID=1402861 RepID=UPI0005894656